MRRSTQHVSQALRGLMFAATLAFLVPAQAASETPATLQGATVITAEQAKSLMEKGVPIIDARVANEYADEHIRGAKNVPYKEKSAKAANFDPSHDSFALNALPEDKAAPIIFYCNAGECWKSYKASKAAIKAGYTKVYWMRGGIPEWKKKGFPVE